jgi:pimeloyl-ACP methyl ester carboxylesterase
MDTWRTWEPVLPLLERRHEVLALTLPGHAGGPRLPSEPTAAAVTDAVEAAIDAAGFSDPPQLVGNSLGGFVALQLAARGRARSVVAFAPAGGWAPGDDSHRDLLAAQREAQAAMRTAAPAATSGNLEAHRMLGMAAAPGAGLLIERALRDGWSLDAARIPPRYGSSGASTTRCCRGRAPRSASSTTGCRVRTTSSSKGSDTTRSWRIPPRRPLSSWTGNRDGASLLTVSVARRPRIKELHTCARRLA